MLKKIWRPKVICPLCALLMAVSIFVMVKEYLMLNLNVWPLLIFLGIGVLFLMVTSILSAIKLNKEIKARGV